MCVSQPRTCVKQPALRTCERQCVCRWPRLEDKDGNCIRRNSEKCRQEASGGGGAPEPEETTIPTVSTSSTTILTSSTTPISTTTSISTPLSTESFDTDTTDFTLEASAEIFVGE